MGKTQEEKAAEHALTTQTHVAHVGSGALQIKQDLTLSQLGATFAQSGMFTAMNTPAKCIVKILTGQELGIGPSASMRSIHVFQGKIELGAALLWPW